MTAPTYTAVAKRLRRPSLMKTPRPPKLSPMIAATVTSPIVETEATRSPAKISGMASGSSIRRSRARGV